MKKSKRVTRRTKQTEIQWISKLRKAIKDINIIHEDRKFLLLLLSRPEMKNGLRLLLAQIEMNKVPNAEEHEQYVMRTLLNVLNTCLTARRRPKDIPDCFRSPETIEKIAGKAEDLLASLIDLENAQFYGVITNVFDEGDGLSYSEIAIILHRLAIELRSLASNPHALQIAAEGYFPGLKPGQGNRPNLRVWYLVHSLSTMFTIDYQDPCFNIITPLHNAIFPDKKRTSRALQKIHCRMIEKGTFMKPPPGLDFPPT